MSNSFPSSRYPRIDALFRAGETVWRQRYGVPKVFPEINTPAYWYWLMWYGPKLFPQIQQNGYAFPSESLISRVIGEPPTAKRFNESGLVDWRRIEGCLRQGGFTFERGAVLDFGCGCGRILRHFALNADACGFFGADVDRELIEWNSLHLDFAAFHTINPNPPTRYDTEQFDAVYGFSVFSHLPLDAAAAWRGELRRIGKPGAVVVLTLHGQHVMNEVAAYNRDIGAPSAETLNKDKPTLKQDGFLFYPYPESANNTADWMNNCRYGNAFFTEAFAQTFWSEGFKVIGYLPAPDHWQDYIILKRT